MADTSIERADEEHEVEKTTKHKFAPWASTIFQFQFQARTVTETDDEGNEVKKESRVLIAAVIVDKVPSAIQKESVSKSASEMLTPAEFEQLRAILKKLHVTAVDEIAAR